MKGARFKRDECRNTAAIIGQQTQRHCFGMVKPRWLSEPLADHQVILDQHATYRWIWQAFR